jgi:hypothetical protein
MLFSAFIIHVSVKKYNLVLYIKTRQNIKTYRKESFYILPQIFWAKYKNFIFYKFLYFASIFFGKIYNLEKNIVFIF